MNKETVVYQGRVIDKKNFRMFLYGANNEKKLVNSWDEYQEAIQSGVWHSMPSKVLKNDVQPKKRKKRVKKMSEPASIIAEKNDDVVIEIV